MRLGIMAVARDVLVSVSKTYEYFVTVCNQNLYINHS